MVKGRVAEACRKSCQLRRRRSFLSHLRQRCAPLLQTVRNDKSFQEARAEEARRIYRVEQVVPHSPVVHLQQKTPGHIFPLNFMAGVLYSVGRLPVVA